jgi:hypothetical protein
MSVKFLAKKEPGTSTYIVDLTGRGATDGIGDTDTVDANLIDGAVEGKKIDEIGPERVLAGDFRVLAEVGVQIHLSNSHRTSSPLDLIYSMTSIAVFSM